MRGADLVAATKSFREREIRYAFDGSIIKKCGGFDISLPETRSGATRSSPFKVGGNQRPERTMSGAAKIFAGFPLHDNLSTGTENSASPLTTPDRVRSGRVLQPQLNLHLDRGITVLHRLLSIGNM